MGADSDPFSNPFFLTSPSKTHLFNNHTIRWFNGMKNEPPTLKVPIPRLKRFDHDRKSLQDKHAKHQAPQACNNCRKRKVKCTGERPPCRNCVDHHMSCTYSQARSDRLEESVSQTLKIASSIPVELSSRTVGSFRFWTIWLFMLTMRG